MVRGAYMTFEKAHSEENNLIYPICESFEATSSMINTNIQSLLENMQP